LNSIYVFFLIFSSIPHPATALTNLLLQHILYAVHPFKQMHERPAVQPFCSIFSVFFLQ